MIKILCITYLFSGNSNNGNLVRDCMADAPLFARVLVGKNSPVLHDLTRYIQDTEDLLTALNSGHMIDVEAYRKKCDSVLNYFHANPLLRWNVQSPSVLYSDIIAQILIHLYSSSILICLMILHRCIFCIIILQTLWSISNRLDSQSLKHRKKACIKYNF